MKIKAVSIGFLVAAMASAPISSASAHGRFHHGHGPVFGLFAAGAAVVAGIATVVTAPIAILADAASGQRDARRGGYRQQADDYSGAAYNQHPPAYYEDQRSANSESPAYNYPQRRAYYAPPAGYYPPPAYNGPPQGYGPPPGYYQGTPDHSGPPSDGE